MRMRAKAWIQVCICLGVLFSAAMGAGADPVVRAEKDSVRFRWAFGALVGPEGDRELVPVLRDTALAEGDELKIMVEPEETCFVYVIYRSPDGSASLLFPGEHAGTTGFEPGKHRIPEGDGWFELDDQAGLETFYLLAASWRLEGLESLFGRYDAADPSGQPALASQIFAEIRSLKRKHKRLSIPHVERPVSIAGNVRNIFEAVNRPHPDVWELAVEISARRFYSRTFTIDHLARLHAGR